MASFQFWWTSEFGSRLNAALSSEGEMSSPMNKKKGSNMEPVTEGVHCLWVSAESSHYLLSECTEATNNIKWLTKKVKQHVNIFSLSTKPNKQQWEIRASHSQRTTQQICVNVGSPVSFNENQK